ncbi:MAG: hypothetical protein ACRDHZ_13025 [Ktedonobacteraceae bacterium]
MSNKYEREIEEILRNLERTEPKAGFGRKSGERLHLRRKMKTRNNMSMPQLDFGTWCLVLAVITALLSGGWAYANSSGNLATGILALIGTVFVTLVAISAFIETPRYSTSGRRYNNVTPLRGNIFNRMRASWHLLMLKFRYRKRKDQER